MDLKIQRTPAIVGVRFPKRLLFNRVHGLLFGLGLFCRPLSLTDVSFQPRPVVSLMHSIKQWLVNPEGIKGNRYPA